MTEYDKKVMMYEEIEDFKKKFFNKFEVKLNIGYPIEPIAYRENFKFLENLGNQLLKEKGIFNRYPEGIKTKNRERPLVLVRSCIYKVASEMGYGCTEIGRHFGFDHATVIHGVALIGDLSDTNDAEVLKLLTTIKNECKNKHRNDPDIKSDNQ